MGRIVQVFRGNFYKEVDGGDEFFSFLKGKGCGLNLSRASILSSASGLPLGGYLSGTNLSVGDDVSVLAFGIFLIIGAVNGFN